MKNANKIWTPDDEELLVKLAAEGQSDRSLATMFSRTVPAVQNRLQILGVKRIQNASEGQVAVCALISAAAPVEGVVDHLHSIVSKRRGLRRYYNLKSKNRRAISLLLRDLLRCREHSQGITVIASRYPGIEKMLFNELIDYLEEQQLIVRVFPNSPIELARYGKSRSAAGTQKLRELCLHFDLGTAGVMTSAATS